MQVEQKAAKLRIGTPLVARTMKDWTAQLRRWAVLFYLYVVFT